MHNETPQASNKKRMKTIVQDHVTIKNTCNPTNDLLKQGLGFTK
jgi:hypothetical protein